ncbi:MAG: cytochrome c [Acidobacteria bacterium]|nr:cytochrome c [Acidobacteriota bacterium]
MTATKVAVTVLLAAAVVAASNRASAGTYQHARATGTRCSTCHDSKQPHLANLNAAGQYFLQRRTLDGYKTRAASPERGRGRKPAPANRPSNTRSPGLAVYTRSCAVCHGPGGRGTPLAAPLAGPRKLATTEAAALTVIKNGIKGTGMAPFGAALADQEIRDVAKYVMTLKARTGPR